MLIRSLSELRALKTGIERSDDVLVAYPREANPGAYDGLDNDAYYPQVLRRIEALPGVRRASVSLNKPGTGGGARDAVSDSAIYRKRPASRPREALWRQDSLLRSAFPL